MAGFEERLIAQVCGRPGTCRLHFQEQTTSQDETSGLCIPKSSDVQVQDGSPLHRVTVAMAGARGGTEGSNPYGANGQKDSACQAEKTVAQPANTPTAEDHGNARQSFTEVATEVAQALRPEKRISGSCGSLVPSPNLSSLKGHSRVQTTSAAEEQGRRVATMRGDDRTSFQPINADSQGDDKSTTSERPTKRRKQGRYEAVERFPAITAPAPHNTPTVPVDSESGAAPGQANSLCHGQDAAAAATRTCWGDAQWHSTHLAVQESSSNEATDVDPQGRDAGAQTQKVPSRFELLLVAVKLDANPGQERDQRVVTAPAGLSPRAADLYSTELTIDLASTQTPPFLSHNSDQQLLCSDRHEDTGASLDGTQGPDQVFVGYQAGVLHAGHVSRTAVALDNSAAAQVDTGGRSGYVLRDGPPLSMVYISSLEAMGTDAIVEGSRMEMACIREEDTGAAPNSTGNDQPRYTTFGRVVPGEVWSGNDEFMGFPANHASSPTSE